MSVRLELQTLVQTMEAAENGGTALHLNPAPPGSLDLMPVLKYIRDANAKRIHTLSLVYRYNSF